MLFNVIINAFSGGNISFSSIIISVLASLAVVFLTMPIHEYAHALIGTKLGDPTPKYTGRLSLNPFNHIDYMGALCIVLFGFGWAKPVQINGRNLNNPKRDMMLIALAGPIANLIIAFVCVLIRVALLTFIGDSAMLFIVFFSYIAQINCYLAFFNLIPIPPFDGSRVLTAILPNKYYYTLMRYERYFTIIILGVIFLESRIGLVSRISNITLSGMLELASLLFSRF
ncbi:MAG: site-2 protease family protein [Clostridia bacterium]|nr:site-2 protease family protein [Clostridia bacterium]